MRLLLSRTGRGTAWFAARLLAWPLARPLAWVELRGFEPLTPSMRTTGSMVVGGRWCRCRVQIGGIAATGHRPGCCICLLHRSGLTLKCQQSGRSLIPCLQNRCRLSATVAHLGLRPHSVGQDRSVSDPVVVRFGGQLRPCRPQAAGLTLNCQRWANGSGGGRSILVSPAQMGRRHGPWSTSGPRTEHACGLHSLLKAEGRRFGPAPDHCPRARTSH